MKKHQKLYKSWQRYQRYIAILYIVPLNKEQRCYMPYACRILLEVTSPVAIYFLAVIRYIIMM